MLRYLALGACLCACTEDEPTPMPEVPELEYCAPVGGWEPDLSAFEDEVLVLINERRAGGALCGSDDYAPAQMLSMSPALRCAARVHALDMATQDYFSNLDPDDLRYSDRAQLAEYEGTALGQNIGAAHATPAQLVTAMMGSAGWCRTLMEPSASEIGVAYVLAEEATYSNYWTQVYGAP